MITLELIKGTPGVEFLHTIDANRHLFRVATNVIQVHEKLRATRLSDPENVDLLAESCRKTSGPLYPLLVFFERQADGELVPFVADGHQRLRVARQQGFETVLAIWVSTWQSLPDAYESGISTNWARYAVGERDLYAILAAKVLPTAEVVRLTGLSKSTVDRLELIAAQDWMVPHVGDHGLNTTTAYKLLAATAKNPEKLEALRTSFLEFAEASQKKAGTWAAKIQAERHKRWAKQDRAKAKPGHYFRSKDWTVWLEALEDEDGIVVGTDGRRRLRFSDAPIEKFDKARVGDAEEWRERYAVQGLFGKKHSEVAIDDLQEIVDQLPFVEQQLRAILEHRTAAERPFLPATSNPLVAGPETTSPVQQNPTGIRIARKGRRGSPA